MPLPVPPLPLIPSRVTVVRTIRTATLAASVLVDVVVHLDLKQLRQLPVILAQADDAYLAARITTDPLGMAIRDPFALGRLTSNGVRSGPRNLGALGAFAITPARMVGGRLRRR
jgi:hypothetical protein